LHSFFRMGLHSTFLLCTALPLVPGFCDCLTGALSISNSWCEKEMWVGQKAFFRCIGCHYSDPFLHMCLNSTHACLIPTSWISTQLLNQDKWKCGGSQFFYCGFEHPEPKNRNKWEAMDMATCNYVKIPARLFFPVKNQYGHRYTSPTGGAGPVIHGS